MKLLTIDAADCDDMNGVGHARAEHVMFPQSSLLLSLAANLCC